MALCAGLAAVTMVVADRLGAPWYLTLPAIVGGTVLVARAARVGAPDQPRAVAAPRPMPAGFGRALLHQMPAPLIVISEAERLTYANPAAQAILPRAPLGAHYSAMIRAPGFVEAIEQILVDRNDVTFTFTLLMERERFFEARASMLPAGASDFGADDQIIVQIEDRTRDKTLLQARTDFIANASHELRTPLASILGYIETLQGHARDDPEARERFLEIMLKQAGRMQRLVDDLMSLSRIEMSAHQRPDQPLDLHRVTVEAASALFPLATRNDVILQLDIAAEEPGPVILGDRDQLSQVIVNLIDNAIKYGGPGQTVRVSPAEADPRYPGHVGISVIDKGPGIARENVHRLTERFFRVNPHQSKDRGGTGLGLAITKHILNRHSGALEIRSELGKGSRFTLWLPVVEDWAGFVVPIRENEHKINENKDLKRHETVVKTQ